MAHGTGQGRRLCQKAQLAIAERDWDKAKQSYLMALGLRSDLPDVHYGLATVYFQQRELTGAAHHFREVTRLDPQRAGAYINLGAVLNLLQQYDEAITALRRGIQLDNGRYEGYYNLGLVYRRKGQIDLAIRAYREAIRLNPQMADAHLNLGNLYLEARAAQAGDPPLRDGRPDPAGLGEGARRPRTRPRDARRAPNVPGTGPAGPPRRRPAIAPAAGSRPRPPGRSRDHATFLTNLHNATIVAEETGRLLQMVVGEELEPVHQGTLSRADARPRLAGRTRRRPGPVRGRPEPHADRARRWRGTSIGSKRWASISRGGEEPRTKEAVWGDQTASFVRLLGQAIVTPPSACRPPGPTPAAARCDTGRGSSPPRTSTSCRR